MMISVSLFFGPIYFNHNLLYHFRTERSFFLIFFSLFINSYSSPAVNEGTTLYKWVVEVAIK